MSESPPSTFKVVQTRVGGPKVIGRDSRGRKVWSSIGRKPVRSRQIYLTWAGLAGDQPTDTRPKTRDGVFYGQMHGGPDKAVYAYPSEHYAHWLADLGETGWWRLLRRFRMNRLGIGPRSFGENWRLEGVDESQVHVGDVWQLGQVQLRVTRARTPCATLVTYFHNSTMMKRMRANGRCGWYLEVLQPGVVPTTGTVTVLKHNFSGLTIADAFDEKMNASDAA